MVRQRHSDVIEPRGLRREEAAHYVGVSPSSFDSLVRDGALPRPKIVKSKIVLWDRRQIDQQIDRWFEEADSDHFKNPYDDISLKRSN